MSDGYDNGSPDEELPLLEWADYSVAVNPTRPLREIALQKNIKIQNWYAELKTRI